MNTYILFSICQYTCSMQGMVFAIIFVVPCCFIIFVLDKCMGIQAMTGCLSVDCPKSAKEKGFA
jgi:hypothetical protein